MQDAASLLFPLLCALASIACHRKAASLVSARIGRDGQPFNADPTVIDAQALHRELSKGHQS